MNRSRYIHQQRVLTFKARFSYYYHYLLLKLLLLLLLTLKGLYNECVICASISCPTISTKIAVIQSIKTLGYFTTKTLWYTTTTTTHVHSRIKGTRSSRGFPILCPCMYRKRSTLNLTRKRREGETHVGSVCLHVCVYVA